MSEIDFDAIIRFSSKNYSNPEILRIFYIIDLRFLGEHHTGVLLSKMKLMNCIVLADKVLRVKFRAG